MRRQLLKEIERVEGSSDLDDRAEFEAKVTRAEAADDSAAARGLALAVLVSAVLWFILLGLIAMWR